MKARDLEKYMTIQEKQILASYNFWDDDDISTERLLALVCDECNCEIDEVVDVLVKYKSN